MPKPYYQRDGITIYCADNRDVLPHLQPVASVVMDPFLGSGTTLIAATELGRTCYGIELDPRFVDVIIRRWEEFTGLTAVREEAE